MRDSSMTVSSPVDGRIEQSGVVEEGLLMQAKGSCSAWTSWSGQVRARRSTAGSMRPSIWHRITTTTCTCLAGRLLATHKITGRSLPVNMLAINNVNGLYTQNERVVMLFDSGAGLFIMVLVGALFVDSIDYATEKRVYGKGEDVGKFNFGSTVVLILSPELTEGMQVAGKKIVCMGDAIVTS